MKDISYFENNEAECKRVSFIFAFHKSVGDHKNNRIADECCDYFAILKPWIDWWLVLHNQTHDDVFSL